MLATRNNLELSFEKKINIIPLIPKNILQLLINLESIPQKIIDSNVSTSKTITDVQSGLKTGDVNKIKGHVGALQSLTKNLTSILPK